ncbi:MAG: metallopeptidase family protein [Rubricella sp.]
MDVWDRAAPSLEDFIDIAEAARAAIPDPWRQAAGEVALRVADLADDDTLREMEIENPYDLTGLYDGTPLTEKSVLDQPEKPDAIWLYRLAILEEWIDRGDVPLRALIGHVYVHELAHHFGWSDDDIASIDPWWE